MPKPQTPQEVSQMISDMVDAGFNEDEIDQTLRAQGVNTGPQPFTEKPPAEQALTATQQLASILGPIVGGTYGSALTAGKGVPAQFLGEMVGTTTGDVVGRFASNQPQDIKQSLITGGTAGGLGTAFRGLTRASGAIGGVPGVFTQEAGIPRYKAAPFPPINKVVQAAPRTAQAVEEGRSAESALADRVRAAATKLSSRLTGERQAKQAILSEASKSGVLIPVAPIQDALRSKIISDPGPITADTRLFNSKVQSTIDELGNQASSKGGTLSPYQIDRLIRQQLRPKIYTSSGQPSHTMYAEALGEAERSSTALLNDALPGDVRKLNDAISARLDAAEQAAKLFGEDRPGVINRLRTIHQPGNEDSIKSLLVLAHEVDPTIAKDVMRVATKRAFAGDIREPSQAGRGGFFGIEARTPFRMGAQMAAPFQAFAGPAAAPFVAPYTAQGINYAQQAFQSAMQPKANP